MMQCDFFGQCGSCTLYELDYEAQLQRKIDKTTALLGLSDPDIIRSQPSHFRNRAEFRIWHEGDRLSYAMHRLDRKGLVQIDACAIVSEPIALIMEPLLQFLKEDEMLSHKLFAIEFLSSTTGNLLTTLIYHKKIDAHWAQRAKRIEDHFGIRVVGRSRGVKLLLSQDYIEERLTIQGQAYAFKLYESGFIQPNLHVNEKMIGWVLDQIPQQKSDLLELYCGHGNFTIPLSQRFEKVLATEISKASIKAAQTHCALNHIDNITFVRLSAQEITSALNKERTFRRLEGVDLDSYRFSHLFVDPPRAGLDEEARKFCKRFEHLIYISCNPATLKRDLDTLSQDFRVKSFALFDQFPYTEHMECGIVLERR